MNLPERLNEHNAKHFPNCFTANDDSWQLFFEISNLNYHQARKIETHVKSMKSSKYILNIIKYPEMIEKLKEKYS